jgi:hypothetical protein
MSVGQDNGRTVYDIEIIETTPRWFNTELYSQASKLAKGIPELEPRSTATYGKLAAFRVTLRKVPKKIITRW